MIHGCCIACNFDLTVATSSSSSLAVFLFLPWQCGVDLPAIIRRVIMVLSSVSSLP